MAEYVYGMDGHEGHWLTGEEIVRCRDCKNCEMDYTDGVMFGETVCWAWDNGHDYPHLTSPDGFCYRGERKEVDA
jgi:hypothetical protein